MTLGVGITLNNISALYFSVEVLVSEDAPDSTNMTASIMMRRTLMTDDAEIKFLVKSHIDTMYFLYLPFIIYCGLQTGPTKSISVRIAEFQADLA